MSNLITAFKFHLMIMTVTVTGMFVPNHGESIMTSSLEGVKQFYIAIEEDGLKLDTLSDLYEELGFNRQAIIYCNTQRKVDWLSEKMADRDFSVSIMHAELDQQDKDRIMGEFRSRSSQVLISTDSLRDIEMQQEVSLVINYDLPANIENYLHRIGRSGRLFSTLNGSSSSTSKRVVINFVTLSDARHMKDIENHYHTQIDVLPMDFADLIEE